MTEEERKLLEDLARAVIAISEGFTVPNNIQDIRDGLDHMLYVRQFDLRQIEGEDGSA